MRRHSHRGPWRKGVPSTGGSLCKGPEQDGAWHVGRTARRPVWLEQSERVSERERGSWGQGGNRGRSCRAVWTAGRTWALT